VSHPFRVSNQTDREPRALPWARQSDPFGVKHLKRLDGERADIDANRLVDRDR
jgi:hypothetical protein